MGNAIAFDTHVFFKKLQEAGFTEKQAEELSSAQTELREGNLATKLDIAAIHHDIFENGKTKTFVYHDSGVDVVEGEANKIFYFKKIY